MEFSILEDNESRLAYFQSLLVHTISTECHKSVKHKVIRIEHTGKNSFKLTWTKGSSKLFWPHFVRCPSSLLSLTYPIFIFYSRNTGPISSKLGTEHPWVKEIQVCPRGHNNEIAKIHWRNKKNLFSPELGQTWHNASLGKGESS